MVTSRTPARVSFVGGGSDLEPFVSNHSGAVLCTTIDRYVDVTVTSVRSRHIRVTTPSYDEDARRPLEVRHPLVREAVLATGIPGGIEIAIRSEIPSSLGLGSSSAVTVGLLRALDVYAGTERDACDLAGAAVVVERAALGGAIGLQDQYAVALGGLRLITFGPGRHMSTRPISLPSDRLERLQDSLLLFRVGERRSATAMLTPLTRAIENGDGFEELSGLRSLALRTAAQLETAHGVAECLGRALDEGWALKCRLAPEIATAPVVDALARGYAAGAIGGKLLGAGGGGFLLLVAPPCRHDAIRAALAPVDELRTSFETTGSHIIDSDAAA
jgi:D-glycero-alpha-D-manno-heptose-7-phosphate kinase